MNATQRNICKLLAKSVLVIITESPYKKKAVTELEIGAHLAKHGVEMEVDRIIEYMEAMSKVDLFESTTGEGGTFYSPTRRCKIRFTKFSKQNA